MKEILSVDDSDGGSDGKEKLRVLIAVIYSVY